MKRLITSSIAIVLLAPLIGRAQHIAIIHNIGIHHYTGAVTARIAMGNVHTMPLHPLASPVGHAKTTKVKAVNVGIAVIPSVSRGVYDGSVYYAYGSDATRPLTGMTQWDNASAYRMRLLANQQQTPITIMLNGTVIDVIDPTTTSKGINRRR